MPKRDHAEFSQGPDPPNEVVPSKKVKPGPVTSISALVQHAGELLKCIESLRKSPSPSSLADIHPELRGRLAAVSKQLLPSIQALASEAGEEAVEDGPKGPISVPCHDGLTKWTASDIMTSLPPLPPVNDPTYETAALTHISTLDPSLEGTVNRSYERMEWLGDAYLEMIATGFIFKTFPDLTSGRSTQIREALIRNETLGKFAEDYGLVERATLPPEYYAEQDGVKRIKHKERVKIRGDLFEAYVGAVILSDPCNGVSRVSSWLKNLWAPIVTDMIKKEDRRQESLKQAPEDSGSAAGSPPKVQLAVKVQVPGVNLRYEDLPTPPQKDKYSKLQLFAVGVFMDGWGEKNLQLGRGVGISKKEAGQKAAQMALDNKKLMALYESKKKAFLAASRRPEDA